MRCVAPVFRAPRRRRCIAWLRGVICGDLPLDAWAIDPPVSSLVEVIREKLSAVRGIGPWTINYALLRGFGWLDGSLHGDAAVRRNLQRLLHGSEEQKLGEEEARRWLAQFSPWRALVAAHLWASEAP